MIMLVLGVACLGVQTVATVALLTHAALERLGTRWWSSWFWSEFDAAAVRRDAVRR